MTIMMLARITNPSPPKNDSIGAKRSFSDFDEAQDHEHAGAVNRHGDRHQEAAPHHLVQLDLVDIHRGFSPRAPAWVQA